MEVYLTGLDDQPVTCPKCGSRTDWHNAQDDIFQDIHTCLNEDCEHMFAMEHDLQKEIYNALAHTPSLNIFGLVNLAVLRSKLSEEFQELTDDELIAEVDAQFAHQMVNGKIEYK